MFCTFLVPSIRRARTFEFKMETPSLAISECDRKANATETNKVKYKCNYLSYCDFFRDHPYFSFIFPLYFPDYERCCYYWHVMRNYPKCVEVGKYCCHLINYFQMIYDNPSRKDKILIMCTAFKD